MIIECPDCAMPIEALDGATRVHCSICGFTGDPKEKRPEPPDETGECWEESDDGETPGH